MRTDLHELLDRPLPGEPFARDPAEHLGAGRRALRKRRWATGAGAGAAAAVATFALAVGPTLWPEAPAGEASPATATATATATERHEQIGGVLPSIRARHPEQARIVDCMLARGWQVTFSVDGAIGYEGTTANLVEYKAAFAACERHVSTGTRSVR